MFMSALKVEGYSKDARRRITYFREKPYNVTFESLIKMLSKDYIYSAFVYAYANRGHDNIISEAEMVVIDVDDTTIDAFDRHQQLIDEGLSHIVATTSDVNNMFKYRVLLPLSKPVSKEDYRSVVYGIQQHGLIADLDPASKKPSQFFSAYEGAKVFSYFDGEFLSVEDYLLEEKLEDVNLSELAKLSYKEKKMYLLEKYAIAYKGYRRRTLVKASFEMQELGFTKSQFRVTIKAINDGWLQPMLQNEVYLWIINPMIRKMK